MIIKPLIFIKTSILFIAVQILGIFASRQLISKLPINNPVRISDFGLLDILIIIGLAALFWFAFRYFRAAGKVMFKIFLLLVVFAGLQAFFSSFFESAIYFYAALALVFLFLFSRWVWISNIIMVPTLAGIGSFIGVSIVPETAVLILVAFSFYDIFAVYKTGHMITLAKAMIESGAIFGFIIPEQGTGFKERYGKGEGASKTNRGFMILGSGDVILPLILSSSVVGSSLGGAFLIAGFSVSGLLFMHLIFSSQKEKKPMAALPPIALMAILGYLLVSIF